MAKNEIKGGLFKHYRENSVRQFRSVLDEAKTYYPSKKLEVALTIGVLASGYLGLSKVVEGLGWNSNLWWNAYHTFSLFK